MDDGEIERDRTKRWSLLVYVAMSWERDQDILFEDHLSPPSSFNTVIFDFSHGSLVCSTFMYPQRFLELGLFLYPFVFQAYTL